VREELKGKAFLTVQLKVEGFLSQKTDFKFKVIVHDDASDDNTQDIIREYAEKYPDLFVPILQKENQYQVGKGIMRNHIQPLLEGEYFALCEGDDYWCNPHNMAKEADILFKQKKYRDIVLKNKYLRLFYKQYGLLRTCLLLVRAVSCHE